MAPWLTSPLEICVLSQMILSSLFLTLPNLKNEPDMPTECAS